MRTMLLLATATAILACGSRLPKLRQQLASPDPDVRIAAAKALAEAKDTVSVPKLIELLGDSVPDVRKECAKALGQIGDARAAEPLAELYRKEPIEGVADAGARALLQLGSAAIRPFISLLRTGKPVVRAGAARGLGKLRAREAVPALISAVRDRDETVRLAAVYALRVIGDQRGLEAIATAVQDTSGAVEDAAERSLSGESYQEELQRAKKLARRIY